MGSELQAKYQKLAQEYAKLRSQFDVLKKAYKDEQVNKAALEETFREKSQSLRKYVQENESLEFRNQQLSKRVAMLQADINSPTRSRRKKGGERGGAVPDIHTQELAAKISENERLHMKLLELTQKSERTVSSLESDIVNLEREVATHNAGAEEINREHSIIVETIRNEKAMVEAKLAVQVSEVVELKKSLQKLQTTSHPMPIIEVKAEQQHVGVVKSNGLMLLDDVKTPSLNVPVIDTKLQYEVLSALRGGMELLSTFTTQLSTFHSYLEQRCKAYPRDTAEGLQMTFVNQKLCELLHESSSFTRPLLTCLNDFCNKLADNPLSQAAKTELVNFSKAHHKFVVYLESLNQYLQLSLQEESAESICGPHLLESNKNVSRSLPRLVGTFVCIHDYIYIICNGPSMEVPLANITVCLTKLQNCLTDASHATTNLSNSFSAKIAHEHQLPTVSQKLNTTNECIISALNGICSTAQQLSGLLQKNSTLFQLSLEESPHGSEEQRKSDQTLIVQTLRAKAVNYMKKISKLECPDSVPYSLAVFSAHTHSSSSESRQTLMHQVTANQDKLTKLEQDKEQLVLDLQLLRVKHEKEQQKVASLEVRISQDSSTHTSLSNPSSALPNRPLSQIQPLSDSIGCLSSISDNEFEEEEMDDMVMIRQHFVNRISDLSSQVQESDSKAAHFYAESRGLHKQLAHSTSLRNKIAQDVKTAQDTIQQLQDHLATTSNSYEKQLSAMSDHLCEVNDRLLKQSDELEFLRKTNKGKRWGK